jgi:hypothetical protein
MINLIDIIKLIKIIYIKIIQVINNKEINKNRYFNKNFKQKALN